MNDITFEQAKKRMEFLGFKMSPINQGWGSQPAEPYDVGKDHFRPIYRDVFIATCKGGWYVTSHIHGNMRRYRCRKTEHVRIANIFGGGETLWEAVEIFMANFRTKTYNKA